MQAETGGRLTRSDTLHLTLVFIGRVERSRLPAIVQAAAGLVAADFSLAFDRRGCWRHNKVAYLQPSQVPPALGALVAGLEQALDTADVDFDRRAYQPHVTLVRRADCRLAPSDSLDTPIHWPAREFVLIESCLAEAGPTYRPLARFPMRSGALPPAA